MPGPLTRRRWLHEKILDTEQAKKCRTSQPQYPQHGASLQKHPAADNSANQQSWTSAEAQANQSIEHVTHDTQVTSGEQQKPKTEVEPALQFNRLQMFNSEANRMDQSIAFKIAKLQQQMAWDESHETVSTLQFLQEQRKCLRNGATLEHIQDRLEQFQEKFMKGEMPVKLEQQIAADESDTMKLVEPKTGVTPANQFNPVQVFNTEANRLDQSIAFHIGKLEEQMARNESDETANVLQFLREQRRCLGHGTSLEHVKNTLARFQEKSMKGELLVWLKQQAAGDEADAVTDSIEANLLDQPIAFMSARLENPVQVFNTEENRLDQSIAFNMAKIKQQMALDESDETANTLQILQEQRKCLGNGTAVEHVQDRLAQFQDKVKKGEALAQLKQQTAADESDAMTNYAEVNALDQSIAFMLAQLEQRMAWDESIDVEESVKFLAEQRRRLASGAAVRDVQDCLAQFQDKFMKAGN